MCFMHDNRIKTLSLISLCRCLAFNYFRQALRDAGLAELAPTHARIIGGLMHNGPMTMGALADFIYRDKSTLTTLVRKLSQLGFVRKRLSKSDGRSLEVCLTRQGELLRAKLVSISDDMEKKLLAGFSSAEIDTLNTLLRKIADNIPTTMNVNPDEWDLEISRSALRVALIGASGNVGARLARELAERGHEVLGMARRPEKIPAVPGVTPAGVDIAEHAGLVGLLRGRDAVVSSVRFLDCDPESLIGAVKESGVKRYLIVGGAGSLEIGRGTLLMDSPGFPDAHKPEARKGLAFLEALQSENELDWTFVSPSAEFYAGTRTGVYRTGLDQLLVSEKGSRISFEDFAVALVDELERPVHIRQRFTVGY